MEEKRMRRHKNGYKFTHKSQSKRGIFSLILAALSILIFLCVIVLSFRSRGNGTMYLGSAGVSSMLLALAAFILAVKSLGEENSYKVFPYMATAVSFAALGIWAALYVIGFLV